MIASVAVLSLALGLAAMNAQAAVDDDAEGYEVAPPIYYPKPRSERRPEPRVDSAPAARPPSGIRYKQPKPPGAYAQPRGPLGPTMTYSPLRGEPYVFWQCDVTRKRDILQMRDQEGNCPRTANESKFHPAFARHMDKHLFRCIADAAERAGLPRPARAEVGNRSGLRPHDHRLHGRGRALDLGRVRLFDARGNPIHTGIRSERSGSLRIRNGEIMMHETYYETSRTTQKFYDAFRACWGATLRGCDSIATIGCNASPGAKAPGHEDHIHIQFPESCGR